MESLNKSPMKSLLRVSLGVHPLSGVIKNTVKSSLSVSLRILLRVRKIPIEGFIEKPN